MKTTLARLCISVMLLVSPLAAINNGYHQTTRIVIEGIDETCYGTLLSKESVSGTWNTRYELELIAPQDVIDAFANYEDSDGFFYFNYFQDVTEGLLYWPIYPPEEFKLLLYFPERQTFHSTEIIERYALNSTYRAYIDGDVLHLEQNYDYYRFIMGAVVRILVCSLVAIIVSLIYYKEIKYQTKYIFLTNIVFQTVLNLFVSWYSVKNGFSMVEYFTLMWIPYLICIIVQGYIYSKKIDSLEYPYLCSFVAGFFAMVAGMLLVDVVPRLYTVF